MGKISAQPQFRRAPHTVAAARPPGRSTRRISRSAFSGSATYINPSAQSTASNPASGCSSASASIRRKSPVRPRDAAAAATDATMSSEISEAATNPLAPTVSAARNVTRPVPQATSSTRSPGWSAASASIRSCAGRSCSDQKRS
jgi:hypothetical protein